MRFIPSRRALRITAATSAALLVALGLALYWLTATQSGFRRLMALAEAIPGVSIRVAGVAGTPARGFSADMLTIDHERVRIEVTGVSARLDPLPLMAGTVSIPVLRAARVSVRVKPRLHPPDDLVPEFLPGFLRIVVDGFEVGALSVADEQGVLFEARDLSGASVLTRSKIRALHAVLSSGSLRLGGDATLEAALPLRVSGKVVAHVPVGASPLDATVTVGGDLDVLALDASLARPATCRYVGTLRLAGAPRLEGHVSVDAPDLEPLVRGSPLGRVGASLDVGGWIDGFTIRGPVSARAVVPVPVLLDIHAAVRSGRLEIEKADARAGTASAGLSGSVGLESPAAVDLALDWKGVRWPLSGKVLVTSPTGHATLSGRGPYAYAIAADLEAPSLPPAALAAAGRLRTDGVDVSRLSARLLGGEVTATGAAEFGEAGAWTFAAQARGLDPGGWRPALHGRVAAAVTAAGRGYGARGTVSASLRSVSGQIRGKPVSGSGTFARDERSVRVDHAELHFASLSATANGVLGGDSRIVVNGTLGDLGDFVGGGGGSLRLSASYAGDRGEHILHGTLDGHGLHAGDYAVSALSAAADVDTASSTPSHVVARIQDARWAGVAVGAGELSVSGLAADHLIHLTLRTRDEHAELEAHGSYQAGETAERVRVLSVNVAAPPYAPYHLSAPVDGIASPTHASIGETCLDSDRSHLCATGTWAAGGAYHAAVQLSHLDLGLLPLALPAGLSAQGAVSLDAALDGRPGLPFTAHASAGLEGVAFTYRTKSGRQAAFDLGSGRIEANAAADSVTFEANSSATDDTFLSVAATVVRHDGSVLADAPLSGHVKVRTHELAILPLVVDALDRTTGLVVADLSLSGTPSRPQVDGTVTLTDGTADFYVSNLRLKDVAAQATLASNTLTLDARAKAGDGTMSARGTMAWVDGRPRGELAFRGERLLVANLPEAHVVASPDVRLTLAGDRIDVRGEIAIPSARIQPKDLSKAVRASSDERLVGREAEQAAPPLTIDTEVRLVLGPDVRVDAYGLKGLLEGAVSVSAKTDELVTGNGELEIRDGHYLAYLRELDIERGRLFLRGGPVDNAGLDIRASKKLPGYTAGVNVRGTLQAPQLSFFSDPPLPQSQIASLLVVGQTTGGAASAAGSLLAAQSGGFLVGDYTQRLGIDQMTLEGDANNGTALVLGKFLSPRLYVSYGISLAEAINTLKLRYTIGDNWVVNTESGLNHSADIQFSFQR